MRDMEKMMKQISKELEKIGDDEKDLQSKLDEIRDKMNQGDYEYDEDDESRSYDMLERAYKANSLKQARELAKRALIIYEDNIDAQVFIAELENNETKKLMKINKAIERAEEILKDYFEDSVGHFWGIVETRPYLRALCSRVRIYTFDNKFDEAVKDCEEIIRLNENDNMGIRYSLMNLYCHLNKFDELNKLYNKYPEEDAYMLFPISVMYFKQDNKDKLLETLKEIKDDNKYLIDMLLGKIKNTRHPEYYSPGSIEEATLIIEDAFYLINDNKDYINYLKDNYEKIMN